MYMLFTHLQKQFFFTFCVILFLNFQILEQEKFILSRQNIFLAQGTYSCDSYCVFKGALCKSLHLS